MAAFVIADEVEIIDPALMAEYRPGAGASLKSHHGRVVIGTDAMEILEGDWRPGRLIVAEFPDMASLKSWYRSPEYGALIALRQRAARTNLIAVEGIDQGATMGAFIVADVLSVHDPEAMDEYHRGTPSSIEAHGGRFVVRGGDFEVLEGGWTPGRVVVVEFPDMPALKAWYGSDEYRRLIEIRQSASSSNLIAVPGL